MVIARSKIVKADVPGCYHVTSRCVRQEFLLDYEGQISAKRLFISSLKKQSQLMAVEVLAYAVMSNHVHLVVRIRPDVAQTWSAAEVVDRWVELVPPRLEDHVTPVELDEGRRLCLAADASWVVERRARLCSLSWFMRLIKHRFAIWANKEQGKTGHFWDARFYSSALVDQAAILACMVYVELNPVRARMVKEPSQSIDTSFSQRLNGENSAWVLSLDQCGVYEYELVQAREGPFLDEGYDVESMGESGLDSEIQWRYVSPVITDGEYCALVQRTAQGVNGRLQQEFAHDPLLDRMQLRSEQWLATMRSGKQMLGTVVGRSSTRLHEAAVRGMRWLRNTSSVFN